MAKIRNLISPLLILVFMIVALYWQFFLTGKIPIPADLLVGAYLPWLDSKWGFTVGVPVKNPLISDVFSQFFVWKYLSIDLLRSGQFPLWNSFSFSGIPLLATYHSAVFNPFNLLLFLPGYIGWGLFIFLQTLAAAVGMYLLLGALNIKASFSRIIGAVIFSVSGLMTTWVEFGTGVWAAAMLPWILFSAESYDKSGKVRFLILLALSFATLYLSGNTQLTQYGSLLFLGYLTFKALSEKLSRLKLLHLFGIWVVALGLVAFQILPILDYSGSTIRKLDVPVLGAEHDGLNDWFEIVRVFAADFFGNPATYNFFGKGSYHEQALFLGTLTIPLIAALAIKRKKTKNILFWFGVLAISIILAFKNPFSNFLYGLRLPLITYSNASRIFFLTSLAGGILAAFSVEELLNEKKHIKRLLFSGSLLLAVIVILFGWVITHAGGIAKITSDPQLFVSFKALIIPASLLAVFMASLLVLKNRFLLVLLLLGLLYLDLGRYFLKYNPFVESKLVFPTTSSISFLQEQPKPFRIARLDQEALPPNTWTAYGIESVEGYDAMAGESYAKYMNLANGKLYESGVNRHVQSLMFPSKFLDALNVKFVVSVKRDKNGGRPGDLISPKLLANGYTVAHEDKNTVIFQNPEALERAYFIEKLTVVKNEGELIEKVQSFDFDPTKEVVVVSNKSLSSEGIGSFIEVNDEQNGRVEINTATDKNSFIVISLPFSKDWKFSDNGNKATLYSVNGALMGFMVSPGEHNFKLRYFPNSFDLGLKISLGSAALLLSLFVFSLIKRKW